jgi:YidC/Oxa1 family membrane protein insertase
MDRARLSRLFLIVIGAILLYRFGPKLFGGGGGGGKTALQELRPEGDVILSQGARPPEQTCNIWTNEFRAELTTRGGTLKHFELLKAKYQSKGKPIDLSTTPDQELRRQLRFDFRNLPALPPGAEWNVDGDSFDWVLKSTNGKSCEFSYRDAKVELNKTIATTGRPYELRATATIKNIADKPLFHALTVHSDAWRTTEEVKSRMMRVSALVTHVECVLDDGKAQRLQQSDFDPGKFSNAEHFPRNSLDPGDWYLVPGETAFAGVSNAYFSHAIAPDGGPAKPVCELQIEERWDNTAFPDKADDPKGGAMYRARLADPGVLLAPDKSATYSVLSYIGPKERSVLAEAGGGKHRFSELIDLGFFSIIAKVLVAFLLRVHSVIPNWGVAIIILTVTARTLLFPLTLPGIRGAIKMRELKPEIDALNERFKDDAQAKGLAQMELWRKHKVNPLKGCLPQMASMPVWFALYTTLQTAVELYHIPFLWFPDLSAADPYYVLPFVIGATSYMQQRMMPQQGDPAQQTMMKLMPLMFTVFMLFLPSGLGVYMFTNGLLGILQQQGVEWHARRTLKSGGGAGSGGIKVKVIGESPIAKDGKGEPSKAKDGKGPAPAKLAGGEGSLLGKGKAES